VDRANGWGRYKGWGDGQERLFTLCFFVCFGSSTGYIKWKTARAMIGMGTDRTGKGKGREGRNSVSNDPPPRLGRVCFSRTAGGAGGDGWDAWSVQLIRLLCVGVWAGGWYGPGACCCRLSGCV